MIGRPLVQSQIGNGRLVAHVQNDVIIHFHLLTKPIDLGWHHFRANITQRVDSFGMSKAVIAVQALTTTVGVSQCHGVVSAEIREVSAIGKAGCLLEQIVGRSPRRNGTQQNTQQQ